MAPSPPMLLTPEDLYTQASRYDVDLADEPFLILLMKQAALTPLPPHWVKVAAQDDDDRPPLNGHDGNPATWRYKNELTGQVQDSHPADSYFQQQIDQLRSQHEHEAHEISAHGWMEFEECYAGGDATGSGLEVEATPKKYYYDFVSETRQDMHPLVRLRDSFEAAASVTIADPKVFENATALHRQTTMKNLEQLQILCFHSWWSETSSVRGATKKSVVHMYFSIPTRHFQVVLDDSDQHVFTISHIVGTNGRLLTVWDLHVGARIPVLGRLTTLMQTSLLTRQWLQMHEHKFQRIKAELQSELVKYELKRDPVRTPFKADGRIECADPHRSQAGCSLRHVLNDIAVLKRKLAGYRPDLVRRICASIVDLDE
uniref:WW domain-containing protein n=1 Tax=Globisporangium ultimum (strain ATCC 200006 / CBS 805.95 / DAOM BR144) TaxID=431595 RepID=K3X694_GLOUD